MRAVMPSVTAPLLGLEHCAVEPEPGTSVVAKVEQKRSKSAGRVFNRCPLGERCAAAAVFLLSLHSDGTYTHRDAGPPPVLPFPIWSTWLPLNISGSSLQPSTAQSPDRRMNKHTYPHSHTQSLSKFCVTATAVSIQTPQNRTPKHFPFCYRHGCHDFHCH